MIVKATTLALVLAVGGGTALVASTGARSAGAAARPAATLPVSLRPALYRAIARDAGSGYRIGKNGCARLPKSSLKGCFDSHGAYFSGAGAPPLALRLVAYGRGETLSSVRAVRPEIEGNRVSYSHGTFSEWWRVLPMGFEQGFTVTKRPIGKGELTLALAANRGSGKSGETLVWGELRYGKLVVTDAHGEVVPATLTNEGNRILIAVSDVHAVYPLTVDPLVWLEQKVSASDDAANDNFGASVALSGNVALVGVPYTAIGSNYGQGAAYVFTRSNGSWTQTTELTAGDGATGDHFGQSVAVAGTTALIGAGNATVDGHYSQGAMYVFVESGDGWSQAAKLIASDGAAGDEFGFSVALSGSTALVGAGFATVGGNSGQGAAYVFTESGGDWSQAAKLTADDGAAYNDFGASVALSGTRALIGAWGATVGSNYGQGAAYVFTGSGDTWSQAAKLVANDGAAFDSLGHSVALSGTIALVGADAAAVKGNSYQGAAYVFTGSDGNWNQTAKLTASDGVANDMFGSSVALDGVDALVGAQGNEGYKGAAYLYTEAGGSWIRTRKLVASDGEAGDELGYINAAALAASTVLVGAPFAEVNGNSSQGAAYFYDVSDLGLAVSAPGTVGQGETYVSQAIATNNASAASPAVTATVTVPAATSFVSATATQGSCSETSGVVTCDFGPINGNAGTASANVTLKAIGDVGVTIENTASVPGATPALEASAPTTITAGGACPAGYGEYDGSLDVGKRTHSPIYQAPAGEENAILTGPAGFQLYAGTEIAGRRKIYRIPGNELHRQAPAGRYTWIVKAGSAGGAYTLCVLHP